MIVVCSSCGAAVRDGNGVCCARCGDLVDLYGHVEIDDERPAAPPTRK